MPAELESSLLQTLMDCIRTAATNLGAADKSSDRFVRTATAAAEQRSSSCSLATHALAALHSLATQGHPGAIQVRNERERERERGAGGLTREVETPCARRAHVTI